MAGYNVVMFKDRRVLLYTIAAIFISQLTFWLVFLYYDQLPPQIPLWNLSSCVECTLASTANIWYLPGLSIGIVALHLLITLFINKTKPFMVNFVMGTTLPMSLFLLGATVRLLGLVLGWF